MAKTYEGHVTVLEVTRRVGAYAHILRPGDTKALIFPIDDNMLAVLAGVYPAREPGPSDPGKPKAPDPYLVYVSYEEDENGKPSLVNQIRIPPA